MTKIADYVTETEAARMVGVTAGKGSVWRHLRQHAPHIELVELFGYTAVRRDVLRAYCENGRKRVYRGQKQTALAAIRRAHRQFEASKSQ